jgi:hypothetical protein
MSTQKPAEAYQHKLSEAKRLIDTHNYLRKPAPDDNRVVYEDFISKLVGMGGTANEMLQRVTAEDLQQVCGLPVLMARRLAEIFREDVELLHFDSTEQTICVSSEKGI